MPPAPGTARVVLVGGRVVTPDGIDDDLSIVVEGSRVAELRPGRWAPASADDAGRATHVVDVGGKLVTPGLIDLHVHGGFGASFDRSDDDTLATLLHRFARCGVTSLQASLVSAPVPELLARVDRLASVRVLDGAAQLIGVHLEGPFLAPEQCGAHDPAVLRAPLPDDVAALAERGGQITMITLAPELPGGLDAVARLTAAGIVVAVGHSEASVEDVAAATQAGLSHVTHLWSAQTTLTRCGPWRIPGLLEASLASTALTAEVIADGKHLPVQLLEIARRCLGQRLVVVSDGTAGTGMPPGFGYQLGTVSCVVGEGVGMVVGADAFGGSTSTVPQMLAHLHRDVGWPLTDVVSMVTSRAATVAGVADAKGSIAPGMDADLAIFDDHFVPWATMIGGRWVPAMPGPGADRPSLG